jgi:hypothetical protein
VAKAAFCCSGLSYSVLPSIQIDVVRAVMLIIQPIIILLKKLRICNWIGDMLHSSIVLQYIFVEQTLKVS